MSTATKSTITLKSSPDGEENQGATKHGTFANSLLRSEIRVDYKTVARAQQKRYNILINNQTHHVMMIVR